MDIIKRWLNNTRSPSNYIWWRIVFGLVADIMLGIYVVPWRNHLFDIGDYTYVRLNLTWDFVISAAPLVVLLVLFPVAVSGNYKLRWAAIALAIFPAYLAAAVWLQWITFF